MHDDRSDLEPAARERNRSGIRGRKVVLWLAFIGLILFVILSWVVRAIIRESAASRGAELPVHAARASHAMPEEVVLP